jgi:hypothetical protein
LVLVASWHLAEMPLWGCFLVDVLWHFGIWKMTMKKVLRDVKGAKSEIVSRPNANLNMIKGVKRQQTVITTVGASYIYIRRDSIVRGHDIRKSCAWLTFIR